MGIGACIGFSKDIPLDFVFLVGLVNPFNLPKNRIHVMVVRVY